MNIKIKPKSEAVESMYKNHGHFHEGDAGLDLYIISKQTIKPYESTLIHLGICLLYTSPSPRDPE